MVNITVSIYSVLAPYSFSSEVINISKNNMLFISSFLWFIHLPENTEEVAIILM